MAHEIGVLLRGDPKPYEQAIDRVRSATDEWVLSTESGAEDVDEKFAEVIRSVVDMGKQGGRTQADIEKMLRGIGLDADDAADALKAIEREERNIGDGASEIGKAGDAVSDVSDKASGVGDSLRDLGSIARDVLAGDFESAAQGALDSLGGIAAAAGVGGAVGSAVVQAVSGLVGALVTAFTDYQTKVDEIRDETQASLVDMGGAFDEAALNQRIGDIVNDTEKWRQALLIQKETGLDLSTVLSGLAGDAEDAATTASAFADSWDDISGSTDTQLMYDAKASIEGVNDALAGAPAKVDAVNDAMERQRQKTAQTKDEVARLRDELLKPFANPVIRPIIDDSAIRNYRPPVIQIRARIADGAGGATLRQLLQ